MSLTLDDPRVAQLITDLVDRRVRAALDAQARIRYGTVAEVDGIAGTASLYLGGSATPSPGFMVPLAWRLNVGDLVRAVNRGADRYIEAVLNSNEEYLYRLRLTTTADASLVSTTHAFQIGSTGGLNLIIDNNEIMTRDNSLTAPLYLNPQGETRISHPVYNGESVVTIDANINNWNPTDWDIASVIRVSGMTAARTITGLAAKAEGSLAVIHNNASQNLLLAHDHANSADTNRFYIPSGTGSFTIRNRGAVMLIYLNSRWRVIAP